MAVLRETKITPGTTPVLDLIVDEQDLQDATIYITIKSADRKLTKSTKHDNEYITTETIVDGDEVSTLISVQYTQAETLFLHPGNAVIEVAWIYEDGTADKSDLARLYIPKTLYREEMRYG